MSDFQQANRRTAKRLGYPVDPEHPPVPQVDAWRAVGDVVDRALVLNVVVSCAHGFEVGPAWTWLNAAGLHDGLTPHEVEYLDELESGMHLDDLARRLQVEALWVLLWALSFTNELDFSEGCGGRVTPLLPSLDDIDEANIFRDEAERRTDDELLVALDLVRVIAAGLGDSDLHIGYGPGDVEPYVVWERRRALEWLAGADWDN